MKGEKMDSAQQAYDKKFKLLYKEAVSNAIEIQKQKNETYNGDSVSYQDYASIDNFYFAQMWNKILRIKSIVSGSKNNFEGLQDSLVDLINYTAFFYAETKLKDNDNA